MLHILLPLVEVGAVLDNAVGYRFDRFSFQHVLQLFLQGLYSVYNRAFFLASLAVDLVP